MAEALWTRETGGLAGAAGARKTLQVSAACTLAGLLERLGCAGRERVAVCLCGADEVRETSRPPSTLRFLRPFVDFCAKAGTKSLRVVCVGPGLRCAPGLSAAAASGDVSAAAGCTVELEYHPSLLSEALAGQIGGLDAAVCFNAGVWGYDSWPATVALLAARCPTLITSYNEAEADDDWGALEGDTRLRWLWEPEPNPFASRLERPGAVEGRPLRDNACWQCVSAAD